MYQNEPNSSRPSYEYVNPVYLNTLFGCIACYTQYKRTLTMENKRNVRVMVEWHCLLSNSFLLIRGHLNSEKGDTYKKLITDMTSWIKGELKLKDNELVDNMNMITDYYYKLGITKVEVISNERQPYSSLQDDKTRK